MRTRHLLGSALLAVMLGCGGGGSSGPNPPPPPPPPPAPAPVATVTLDKAAATIIPQFALQLSATLKDAAGSTLTGRTVTWGSSPGAVASVSTDGLVTGLTLGTTSISATSEGKVASATITVSEGAVVGPAGGTVSLASGNAKLTIPAGALTSPLPISITPMASPPLPTHLVSNIAYELGPTGTTFAQPVTLDFKYPAAANAAADSLQILYRIHRLTNGAWVELPGSTVNWATRTATAQTSSFSGYGIGPTLYLHEIVISPNNWGLFVGQTKQFTGTPRDQYGNPFVPTEGISWLGSAGATVSSGGLVTGVLPGGPNLIHVSAGTRTYCNPACDSSFQFWWGGFRVADTIFTGVDAIAEVAVAVVPVKAITVSPSPSTVNVGQVVNLTAALHDSVGGLLTTTFRAPVAWSTSDAAIASVSQTGVVTTLAPGGPVTITASLEGASGTAQVTVTGSTSPVVSISVTPSAPTIEVGTTVSLTATPKDVNGVPVLGRPMAWQSLDATKATVSASGVVTGVSPGLVGIGVTIDGVNNGALVTVVAPYPLVLGSPSTGGFHTCFIRSGNTAWCWGQGTKGQLGNGSTVTEQATPVPVSNGTGYTAISAGYEHTCALDGAGHPFCWGDNQWGQLGDNSTVGKVVPVPVAGGKIFTRIYADHLKSCGLEAGGTAWCWGSEELGNGNTPATYFPVAVAPAPLFSELALGDHDVCGLSVAGEAWCWGHNDLDETHLAPFLFVPTKITGGHIFTHLSLGGGSFCGLKSNGEVWCWGWNTFGQLGDGSQVNRVAPVKVVTPVQFTAISVGSEFACGLATDQTAWCWGIRGMVGVNPGTGPLAVTTPVAVLGGRQFTEISSGGGHTCARAADGTWCWGTSSNGSLGTGIPSGGLVSFVTPVKVRFP